MLRSSRLTALAALVVGAFRHVYHNSPALRSADSASRLNCGARGT